MNKEYDTPSSSIIRNHHSLRPEVTWWQGMITDMCEPFHTTASAGISSKPNLRRLISMSSDNIFFRHDYNNNQLPQTN